MKKLDFDKMTEDELFEYHFELTQEITDATRHILHVKREIVKMSRELDKIELQIEGKHADKLKEENRLN